MKTTQHLFDLMVQAGLLNDEGALARRVIDKKATLELVAKPSGLEGMAAMLNIRFQAARSAVRMESFLIGIESDAREVKVYSCTVTNPPVTQIGRPHGTAVVSTNAQLLDDELQRQLEGIIS